MKVLFDTNVLVSAFLGNSHSYEVIEDAVQEHEVYYTVFVLTEFKDVFHEKFHFSQLLINEFVSFIQGFFQEGESSPLVEKICRDVDDDQILADALLNVIDVIITGDKDLLTMKSYQGIKIISPREYWVIESI